jgi:hypothetical protein
MPIEDLINLQESTVLTVNQNQDRYSDLTYQIKTNNVIGISSEIDGETFDVTVGDDFFLKTEEQKIQVLKILYDSSYSSMVKNSGIGESISYSSYNNNQEII